MESIIGDIHEEFGEDDLEGTVHHGSDHLG
jgi:hypothetical protein